MNKSLFIALLFAPALFLSSCGGSSEPTVPPLEPGITSKTPDGPGSTTASEAQDDPQGVGKYRDLTISPTLDKKKIAGGQAIFDLKCSACHKLDDTKLVGPGWKGVTSRRRVEWIFNFITNVDAMLDKDKVAKGLLATCLVRMPNQNVTEEDAYNIYDFMRNNDGIK